MATEAKRLCGNMKIGTHDGTFHCDEVLACFMLKQLPKYRDAEIIRTRDTARLAECDVVVDVGGLYDPSTLRYDHHQRSFNESMNSLLPEKTWTTKLSSAGLVYLHHGKDVITQILGQNSGDIGTAVLFDKVYERFVEEVDAIDNGINLAEGKQRYTISTNLSSRVGHLNPNWNETCKQEDITARFEKAMALVGGEFTDRVRFYSDVWWPARQLVKRALEERHKVDSSGEIVVFSSGGCPWKEHLVSLEEELKVEPPIKFVLYADTSGKWRVQCVPKDIGSFENRLSLLEVWRGVRDDALSDLSGIPGCIFVHASGFIGGNATYEGALEMARRTLQGK